MAAPGSAFSGGGGRFKLAGSYLLYFNEYVTSGQWMACRLRTAALYRYPDRRDQAITALTITDLLASSRDNNDPVVLALREEPRLF